MPLLLSQGFFVTLIYFILNPITWEVFQATAPSNLAGTGGSLKTMKGQAEKAEVESKDAPSSLKTIGENSAGSIFL